MDERERTEMKEQVRAMAAGRGDGIDLDTSDRWCVEGLKDAVGFFRELGRLIPEDSNLYFEGTELEPEVVRFYEANRAKNAVSVVRDMIFPAPDVFHVGIGPGILEQLEELVGRQPLEKCFYHVKGYRGEKLLFAFHDAFDGSDLLIADTIEEQRVKEFVTRLGASYKREENINKRDPEQLHRFLWALENPDKVKIRGEDGELRPLFDNRPWWKRILMFWKR